MATTTNVIEALKYTYLGDRVAYLFNQESPTFAVLGKTKKPQGGRGQFLLPIVVQNAGAFTGITEGGALPSALQPDTTEASFSLQEYVGLYDVSWKLIEDARNSKFAFQQAIQMLDEGLRRRIMRNLNSDLLDNGKGRLAVLPAADNSSPITVNSIPRVETGMVVDIMAVSDDDTKRADSVTVTDVDPIALTITTSGNPSSSAAGLSMWQAPVLANSGVNRPLTQDLLLQAMDSVRAKPGGLIKAWFSNMNIVRHYHTDILAQERYFSLSKPGVISGGVGRPNKEVNEEGLSPYEFSGVPWYVDPFFNANVVIGADTDHFFLGVGENETPRPISEIFENVPFFRQTSNATFEVAWYYQMEFLSDGPSYGAQVQDVAES